MEVRITKIPPAMDDENLRFDRCQWDDCSIMPELGANELRIGLLQSGNSMGQLKKGTNSRRRRAAE